jgi:hypothetical protein
MSVSGEDGGQAREAIVRQFTDSLAMLDGGVLRIVQLAPEYLTVWEVKRSPAGVPTGRQSKRVSWSSIYNGDDPNTRELHRVTEVEKASDVIFVCSSLNAPNATRAYETLRRDYSAVPAFQCTAPLDGLLQTVLIRDPLTQPYELVVLRRTRSGHVKLGGHRMFHVGARSGDRHDFTIRSVAEESDTVFAVVATESARNFELVSVESGCLPPGVYAVTADLRAPGHVGFQNLPAALHEDHRGWAELLAAVPDRLDFPRPAHLICAVEISGSSGRVDDRLERIEQLIHRVADSVGSHLNVSLISYGSHSFVRNIPEEPVRVAAWATTSHAALAKLAELRARGAVTVGYAAAAQIECVLTEVADRLTGDEGRPVLVTVGARTAFPPAVDPETEIIPCPRRRDWRQAVGRLAQHQGFAFGAIHDHGPGSDVWAYLSNDAFAHIDAFNVQGFGADLGLVNPTGRHVPFPMIEVEGV